MPIQEDDSLSNHPTQSHDTDCELARQPDESTHDEQHRRLVDSCPAHWRPWLMETLRSEDMSDDVKGFLNAVGQTGLLNAVLSWMEESRPYTIDSRPTDWRPEQWERQSSWDRLPASREERFAFLLEGLKVRDRPNRYRLVKLISCYAPDQAAAAAALTDLLIDEDQEIRWHAAVLLAALAPPTPNLVKVLCEAVQADWVESWDHRLNKSVSGCTASARSLGALGSAASAALPTLAIVCLKVSPNGWSQESEDWSLVNAFLAVGGSAAELAASLIAANRSQPSHSFLTRLKHLAGKEVAALRFVVHSLTGGMEYGDEAVAFADDYSVWGQLFFDRGDSALLLHGFAAAFDLVGYLDGLVQRIDGVTAGEAAQRQELNATVSRARILQTVDAFKEFVQRSLSEVLGRIFETPQAPEEQMLAAVMNRVADEHNWLVYADWLEEQGDPRASYVRLRQELLRQTSENDPSRPEREEGIHFWLNTHGQGWQGVYDAIAVWRE